MGATVEALHQREERPPTRTERFARVLQRILERSAVTGAGGDPYFGPGVAAFLTEEYEGPASANHKLGATRSRARRISRRSPADVLTDLASAGNVVIVGPGRSLHLEGRAAGAEGRPRGRQAGPHRQDNGERAPHARGRRKDHGRQGPGARPTTSSASSDSPSPTAPYIYHLVVNTSGIDLDYATDLIVRASADLEAGKLVQQGGRIRVTLDGARPRPTAQPLSVLTRSTREVNMRFGFYLPNRGSIARPGAPGEARSKGGRPSGTTAWSPETTSWFPTRSTPAYPYTVGGDFPVGDGRVPGAADAPYLPGGQDRAHPPRSERDDRPVPQPAAGRQDPGYAGHALGGPPHPRGGRRVDGGGVHRPLHPLPLPSGARLPTSTCAPIRSCGPARIRPSRASTANSPASGSRPSRPRNPIRRYGSADRAAAPSGGRRRWANGWHPVGAIPAATLEPEELAQDLGLLHRQAEAVGRDPSAIDVAMKAPLYDPGRSTGADRRRVLRRGRPDPG